ncbi:MAG: tyrosine-type recombinase/integrase, partial [Christensenellales bacterium]|jgi:integrase
VKTAADLQGALKDLLGETIQAMLEQEIDAQIDGRESEDPAYSDSRKYERSMERIERTIDLHGATAHILRHTYLTLLNNAGIDPKTIQAIGGHADIGTTMNRYVHSQQKQVLSAGETMGKVLPFV